jgi:hypothetical protein
MDDVQLSNVQTLSRFVLKNRRYSFGRRVRKFPRRFDVDVRFRPCSLSDHALFDVGCLLKFTNIELQLLTDPEMFVFVESGIRGGISVISNRYARANNPYLKPEDYDSSKPHSYIIYLDANNLYGWAMSQPLPVGGFRFLTDEEISQLD